MKFFLDENFPNAAVTLLEDLGHSVFDARDKDLEGADDTAILKEAQDLQAVLLTTDRDFYHTLSLQFPVHHGVVVIALKQPSRDAILQRFDGCWNRFPRQNLRAALFSCEIPPGLHVRRFLNLRALQMETSQTRSPLTNSELISLADAVLQALDQEEEQREGQSDDPIQSRPGP